MKDFFVSFNKADRTWATWIAWTLEEAGQQLVFQDWDFGPGTNFVLQMDVALRECRRVLIVLSPSFLKSSFTAAEWSSAFAQDPAARERKLLPIRVEPCEVTGLLGPLVYVDLLGSTEDEARERLLAALSTERRRPAARPPFPGSRPPAKPGFPGAGDG